MERWYLPIRCHPIGRGEKHAERLIDKISNYIRVNRLYNMVPVIHIEKKPRGEFFLFMGIESEQDFHIPTVLVPLVKQIGNPLPGSVDYDQIAGMVSGPVIPRDYARRIIYREQPVSPQDDPFDFFEEVSSPHEISPDEQVALLEDYSRLLYWLSAAGSGTWPTFKNVCRTLGLDITGFESRRILRRLRLLGHLEVSRDGTHWAACPPSLVPIKTERVQEYFLAGQRSRQLLEEIKGVKGVALQFVGQPGNRAPVSVRLQVETGNALDKIMEGVGHHIPLVNAEDASQKLAEILPDLEGWREQLTPIGRFLPSLYEVERFVHGSFVPCDSMEESGMYRLSPRDSSSQVSHTLYFHQESHQWLQGDWYSLRFLALRQANVECRAFYHHRSRHLAVPVSQRWPDLYERALVLCSGRLADQQNEWLFFEEVPREVAQKLADKLTVDYEEVN